MKFYRCRSCGKIIGMVRNTEYPTLCCGEAMAELIPGTSDGAAEKHVPVFTTEGNTVTVSVGSVAHPMADVHYIEWIAIETAQGAQRKPLQPGDAPEAKFALTGDDKLLGVYAYCNLHGLWKAE